MPWTTWPAVPDGAAGTADAGIGIEPDCPGQAVIGRQLENPRSSAFICGSIREFRREFRRRLTYLGLELSMVSPNMTEYGRTGLWRPPDLLLPPLVSARR